MPKTSYARFHLLAVALILSFVILPCHALARAADGQPTTDVVAKAKKKNPSLITDSLWGNLILELAYDRDPLLSKLGTGIKLMNVGTTGAVSALSAATMFQGIYAIAALNPPAGHQDSYVPGIAGIVTSGCTIATLTARTLIGHELATHVRKRQLELKGQVETLLAQLEDSHCQDPAATAKLADMIGARASNEWIQIWRATHRMSTDARRIGMEEQTSPAASTVKAASLPGAQQ